MSRIIEFRVWEKGTDRLLGYEYFNTMLNNGFFYTNLSELKEGETEEDLLCHSEFHKPSMLRPTMLNQLLREEYIGINDINGVKIYEGDFVRTNGSMSFSNYDSEKGAIRQIFKQQSGFVGIRLDCVFDMENNSSAYVWSNYQLWNIGSSLEVIGNIHQNK